MHLGVLIIPAASISTSDDEQPAGPEAVGRVPGRNAGRDAEAAGDGQARDRPG